MLIGLCGKLGSGKDFIAQNYIIPFIQKMYRESCLQVSFADQIKINVMSKHNIPFDDIFEKKNKDTRTLLQQEGTECGRQVYGDDIWIKYFHNWTNLWKYRGIQNLIVTDVRFKNELEYIKNSGGIVIKVVSPHRNEARLQQESCGDDGKYNMIKSHQSECDLDDLEDCVFDLVIHNDENDEDTLKTKMQILLDKTHHK